MDQGEVIALSAQVSGGDPPYSCTWSQGDQVLGTGACAAWTVLASSVGTGIFSVRASDAQDRSGSSGPLSVPVASPLTLGLPEGPISGDAGVPIHVVTTIANGTGNDSCSWRLDGRTIAEGASCTSLQVTVSGVGTHVLVEVARDSATPPVSVEVNLTVDVHAPLSVQLVSSVSHPSPGQVVVLTVAISGGAAPYTAAWTLNGSAIASNATTLRFSAVHGGTYTFQATLTDAAGSTLVASPLVVSVSSSGQTPPSNSVLSPIYGLLSPRPILYVAVLVGAVALSGVLLTLTFLRRHKRGTSAPPSAPKRTAASARAPASKPSPAAKGAVPTATLGGKVAVKRSQGPHTNTAFTAAARRKDQPGRGIATAPPRSPSGREAPAHPPQAPESGAANPRASSGPGAPSRAAPAKPTSTDHVASTRSGPEVAAKPPTKTAVAPSPGEGTPGVARPGPSSPSRPPARKSSVASSKGAAPGPSPLKPTAPSPPGPELRAATPSLPSPPSSPSPPLALEPLPALAPLAPLVSPVPSPSAATIAPLHSLPAPERIHPPSPPALSRCDNCGEIVGAHEGPHECSPVAELEMILRKLSRNPGEGAKPD